MSSLIYVTSISAVQPWHVCLFTLHSCPFFPFIHSSFFPPPLLPSCISSPSGNVPNYFLLSNFNPSPYSSAFIPQHGTLVDPRRCPLSRLVSVRLYTQLYQGTLLTSHLILHPLTFLCPTPCLLPFFFSSTSFSQY